MITVLAGGVGAARFLQGLLDVVPPEEVTAVVNVGDDLVLHGLHISPDLDTVTYTLAGAINPETGWGLAGETWQAMTTVEQYAGEGEVSFQEYFVGRQHSVPVSSVRFAGVEVLVLDQSQPHQMLPLESKNGLVVRHLRCPRRGKSAALNLGVREARAPWHVFTDDDSRAAAD